ncbi:uracil nucleotide/cysteinyl leukotriene receptor [Salminus brasiliensis]|uniref:uracil nucleotide/cysteinyl leukotriene receptor n=1 Tax=Salminus brasiliensis TaxID=930266 RepID=UPI003B839C92
MQDSDGVGLHFSLFFTPPHTRCMITFCYHSSCEQTHVYSQTTPATLLLLSSRLLYSCTHKRRTNTVMKMESSPTVLPTLSTNQSMEGCVPVDSTVENMLFGLYYIIVFLLALNGNSLALWIFSRQRGTSSPANVFLMHLAVADLSYVIILPLRATYHLTGGHWPFGEVPCRVAGFLFYVNMYASLYFLACVAADRYLAVVHAVSSLKVRHARFAHAASFALWALVIVSMAPLLVTQQTTEVDGSTVCLQLYREKASRRALISLAVAFTPPFVATLSCYLLIVNSLRKGSRLEPALKLRALRTIGLVMLIYVVCFLPYHVSRATFILGYGHPDLSCQTKRGLVLANRLTSSLTCLNGVLDPLVYLFGAEKFRGTVRRLLCRDKSGRSTPTSGELKGTHESSLSAKSEF